MILVQYLCRLLTSNVLLSVTALKEEKKSLFVSNLIIFTAYFCMRG